MTWPLRFGAVLLTAVLELAQTTGLRAQDAPAGPAFWIELNAVHAYTPRSTPADALAVAFAVSVNGHAYPTQTFAVPAPLAASGDYTFPAAPPPQGLAQFQVALRPADSVVISYAVVNAHSMDGPQFAQSVLTRYVAAGGQPAADANSSLWPEPLVALLGTSSLFLAKCDGVVAADAFIVTGGQLARWIADARGPALNTHNFEGPTLPRGCGPSNYDVTVRFRNP